MLSNPRAIVKQSSAGTLTCCCHDVFVFLSSGFSMLALHPKATEVDYGEIELKA